MSAKSRFMEEHHIVQYALLDPHITKGGQLRSCNANFVECVNLTLNTIVMVLYEMIALHFEIVRTKKTKHQKITQMKS